jgi:hypothetical protein
MSTEQTSKIKSFLGTVAAGAAAVVGFILVQASEQLGQMGGAWLGSALFLPIVIIALCCWIATKVLGPEYDHLKIAIGITSAQTIMLVLAGLLAGGGALAILLPAILVLGLGTAWLVARPGMWPVVLLLGFEVLTLGLSFVELAQYEFSAGAMKGAISGVLLKVAAIIFLYGGLRAVREKPTIAA